jgi:hypothetical protein
MLEYVVSVPRLASLQNLEATLTHDVNGNGSSITFPQTVEYLTVLSESSSSQNIGGKNLPERREPNEQRRAGEEKYSSFRLKTS